MERIETFKCRECGGDVKVFYFKDGTVKMTHVCGDKGGTSK